MSARAQKLIVNCETVKGSLCFLSKCQKHSGLVFPESNREVKISSNGFIRSPQKCVFFPQKRISVQNAPYCVLKRHTIRMPSSHYTNAIVAAVIC